ncbi:PRK06851 family protein [Bacillus sp. CGMCC 1.16607]|uniref:PRK06851 family protein n=1 Tax=Bacillus sp. CGMCC 1.16607 TaxID=3351842 RepID=UPI003629F8B0
MAGKIKNYFAGGNTARGFHSLYDSNLKGLDRLFILKGGPGTGKSSLMKKIGDEWTKKGYDIEMLHCSSDNDSVDGVIIPALKVGVVDGTAPHIIEPTAAGAIEEYINLGEAWDSDKLAKEKGNILKLNGKISESFKTAYATFAEALKIHDEWEKIYINSMDFEKADSLTNSLIEKFFGKMKLNKTGDVRHRFLGAATPKGAVDFVPNLTENLAKRYFIKGRAGSGKSTLLKKVAASAEERGFDVEVYHCGFDPNSLDMVIVREIGLAIFDSTAPHEYFPSNDSDEIIDMYESLIAPGTDEIFAEDIGDISNRYKEKMKEATSHLANAKTLHDDLEKIYIGAMDFSVVDEIQDKIQAEIGKLAERES